MMASRGSFRLSEIRCPPGRLSLDGDYASWLKIMGREDVSQTNHDIWFSSIIVQQIRRRGGGGQIWEGRGHSR